MQAQPKLNVKSSLQLLMQQCSGQVDCKKHASSKAAEYAPCRNDGSASTIGFSLSDTAFALVNFCAAPEKSPRCKQ